MDQAAPAVEEAVAVLQKFLAASGRKDETAMRECLSKRTLEAGGFTGAAPDGITFTLGEPVVEGEPGAEQVVVSLKGAPKEAPPEGEPQPMAMELPAILIREDGQWKFDLVASMDRMMGGSMEQAMDQVAGAMKQAMEGIGEALGEGFKQAFGESGGEEETPNWDNASDYPAEEECLPMPRMEALPITEKAVSEAVGTPVEVLVAMDDLLQQVASDQRQVLIDWFENTLFARWGAFLTEVAVQVNLAGQLRAIRFESAPRTEHRFLALEGSDLVYRLYLNDNTDGFYSDDEIQARLPAILAALPEHPSFNGFRMLANEEEYPSLDVYKERVVPRFMKRISDHLGKPIALEADWDQAHDPSGTARLMQRWGLNRIWGAIAFICPDPEAKQLLASQLKKIRIRLTSIFNGQFAVLENGVFQVGLKYFEGEKGCLYEHDLVQALLGNPINPEGLQSAKEYSGEVETPGGSLAERDAAEYAAEMAAASATAANPSNDLFSTAVESLRLAEESWREQLQLVLGHPTGLFIAYEALRQNYDLVQPFVHQAISGSLGAISALGFDPQWKATVAQVQMLQVSLPRDEEPTHATYADGMLTMFVKLGPEGHRPHDECVAAITTAMRGVEGAPEPHVHTAEEHHDHSHGHAPGDNWSEPQDIYEYTAELIGKLEQALRQNEMWPGDKPEGPIEVKGAFGSQNMAFEQWLAWILIPRLQDIVKEKGEFPKSSALAAYAVRDLSGTPGESDIVEALQNIDNLVNSLPGSNA